MFPYTQRQEAVMDAVEKAVRLDDEGQHGEAMIVLFDEIERLRAEKLHWEHQNGLLEAEVERLQEKVEILEAEIRVMRKLPAAIDAAMSRVGG
jgi:hypothetical protein